MEGAPPLAPHPIDEVDSYVVAAHPGSTDGPLAVTWAHILQRAEPDRKVFFVATQGCDVSANGELLINGIQQCRSEGYKNPLFISGGGDGTLHYNMMALHRPDTPPEVARTLVTPWKLGMACDAYRSLHAPETDDSPLALLAHPDGHILESSPLVVKSLTDDDILEDIALLYATAGPSADAAYKLATPEHRAWRRRFPKWLHKTVDMAASAPIVLGCPRRVDATPGKGPATHYVVEAEFINGTSMSGQADFSRSTHLGDRALHYAEIRHANPVAVSWFVGRLATGHPPGYRTEKPAVLTFRDGTVHGQIDGEPIFDAAGNVADIRALWVEPSPRTIRYYATRRQSNPAGTQPVVR